MNFNNYTIKAQEVIQKSSDIAKNNTQQSIEPTHILLGLLEVEDSIIPHMLKKAGVNVSFLRQKLNTILDEIPKVSGATGGQFLANDTHQLLEVANQEAGKLKDEFISSEHLLLALLKSKSKAGKLLKEQGLSAKMIHQILADLRKGERITDQNPEAKYNSLQKYARNLNDLARSGKLDPVIGREDEIRRVIHILPRRTKNNPILIGEPGVEKRLLQKD